MTALIEYLNVIALAVFDAIYFHEFSCGTTIKCVNSSYYSWRLPYDSEIIPDSFYHLLFQNYSGIMYNVVSYTWFPYATKLWNNRYAKFLN